MKPAANKLETLIFGSRWLQAPLYLGLMAFQGIFVWQFMGELWHLLLHITTLTEIEAMLAALGMIDLVMVANLLVMVIVGGYQTFVSRLDLDEHPDQPEWLSHINASVLKIKLATALIAISSIHLLKSFFNTANLDEKALLWQVVIHLTFVVSAFMMAWTDKLMNSTAALARQHH